MIHRRSFISTAVATVALGAGLGRVTAMAQEATPDATTPVPPDLIQRWVTAIETEDTDGLVALYTPDGSFAYPSDGTVFHGPDEIRAGIELQNAAFSNISMDIDNIIQCGDSVAIEATFGGIYDGQLEGLPPGIGQPFSFWVVVVMELEDGLIKGESDYFDNLSFLTQLGAFGSQEASASPTA